MNQVAASLAEVGMRFLGMLDTSSSVIPPKLAAFASSCIEAVGVSVDVEDPRMFEKANDASYRLAMEGGLFGKRGFLLAVRHLEVNTPEFQWWARIAFLDQWDVVERGSESGVLGRRAGYPAFLMLSLDGNVILRGDRGESTVDFTLVRNPGHIKMLIDHGEWLTRWSTTDEFSRQSIRRWLDTMSTGCPPAP